MTKIRSSLLIAALVALAACGTDDGADSAADEATAGDVLVDDAPADPRTMPRQRVPRPEC